MPSRPSRLYELALLCERGRSSYPTILRLPRLLPRDEAGVTREQIRMHLEKYDIEFRPVWKPMHLQPVFHDCRVIGGSVS